jgi:hypothetical protein
MEVIAEATARWASRLTLRGQLQGTLVYSAPEQLCGEDASPAADIYAWAISSIEMLTGKLVMAGATIHETLDRQLGPEPVPIPPGGRCRRGRPRARVHRREADVCRALLGVQRPGASPAPALPGRALSRGALDVMGERTSTERGRILPLCT